MRQTINSATELERFEYAVNKVVENGIDLTTAQHDWAVIGYICASFGEQGRESFHKLSSLYPDYHREEADEKFSYCLQSYNGEVKVGTFYKMCQDHGIDISLPRGPKPKSTEQKQKERENRFRLMREQISRRYKVRFNVWKNRVEITEDGSGWKTLDERDLSTIYTRLQDAGLNVKISEVNALLGSRDFSTDYDVVRAYLDALPPYDPASGTDPIRDFFIGHLRFGDPEHTALYERMLRKWFVGMVALWLGQVSENPLMPVFCGTQHIGKTYFIRHILPPQLRDYLKEPNPRDPVDKDFMISLSEVVMIFLDEFSISSNLKSDTYKAIITSTQTNLRDAYGHFREVRKRKASLIGATNYRQFIRDAEGIRRYLGIDLTGTVNLSEHPLDYEGAYAQAIWLLNNGFDPKPDHDESLLLTDHNHSFLEPNDCEEALAVFLRQPQGEADGEWMTSGEIFQEMANRNFRGRGFSTSDIGRAMKRLGFQSKILKGKTRYRLVIADYDRQRRDRADIDSDDDTPIF